MIFTQIDKKNNMNVVRYYLCTCIIMNHFNVLNQVSLPMLPRIFGGVGSFFAISGFLMFASYEKHCNLKGYVNRRIRRILPPYVMVVVAAAIGLSLISSLPLTEYFTNSQFYKYLLYNLAFLNFLEPSLPGVFGPATNHVNAVNGALWTMKGEVVCYLMVPFIFALIRKYSRYTYQILIALIAICFTLYVGLTLHDFGDSRSATEIIAMQFRMFTFFFIGALLNLCLPKIKQYKWPIFVIVLALLGIATLHNVLHLTIRPFTDSMLVIWFSMIGTWGHALSKHSIVSYQMYLFHFPIIQVFIALGLIGNLWFSLFLIIALTYFLARLSWKYIDKPLLG